MSFRVSKQTSEQMSAAEQANERVKEGMEERTAQYSTRQFHIISTNCALQDDDELASDPNRGFLGRWPSRAPVPNRPHWIRQRSASDEGTDRGAASNGERKGGSCQPRLSVVAQPQPPVFCQPQKWYRLWCQRCTLFRRPSRYFGL